MTQICVSKLTIIGSDNGLSPDRRQAIIWTNAGILSIGPLGTKLSEILIAIHIFSFNKMHLKMPYGKWRPCCLGLNVLTPVHQHFKGYVLQYVWSWPFWQQEVSCSICLCTMCTFISIEIVLILFETLIVMQEDSMAYCAYHYFIT